MDIESIRRELNNCRGILRFSLRDINHTSGQDRTRNYSNVVNGLIRWEIARDLLKDTQDGGVRSQIDYLTKSADKLSDLAAGGRLEDSGKIIVRIGRFLRDIDSLQDSLADKDLTAQKPVAEEEKPPLKIPAESKLLAVLIAHQYEGWPISRIAAKAGVSRRMAYKCPMFLSSHRLVKQQWRDNKDKSRK